MCYTRCPDEQPFSTIINKGEPNQYYDCSQKCATALSSPPFIAENGFYVADGAVRASGVCVTCQGKFFVRDAPVAGPIRCLERCPGDRQIFSNYSHAGATYVTECLAECAAGQYQYTDADNRRYCGAECVPPLYHDRATMTCVADCGFSGIADVTRRFCLGGCPGAFVADTENLLVCLAVREDAECRLPYVRADASGAAVAFDCYEYDGVEPKKCDYLLYGNVCVDTPERTCAAADALLRATNASLARLPYAHAGACVASCAALGRFVEGERCVDKCNGGFIQK